MKSSSEWRDIPTSPRSTISPTHWSSKANSRSPDHSTHNCWRLERIRWGRTTLTRWTAWWLGDVFRGQDKHAESEPFHQRALGGYERTVGEADSVTLSLLDHLAQALSAQDKYAETDPLYHRLLAILEDAERDPAIPFLHFRLLAIHCRVCRHRLRFPPPQPNHVKHDIHQQEQHHHGHATNHNYEVTDRRTIQSSITTPQIATKSRFFSSISKRSFGWLGRAAKSCCHWREPGRGRFC